MEEGAIRIGPLPHQMPWSHGATMGLEDRKLCGGVFHGEGQPVGSNSAARTKKWNFGV